MNEINGGKMHFATCCRLKVWNPAHLLLSVRGNHVALLINNQSFIASSGFSLTVVRAAWQARQKPEGSCISQQAESL